MRGDAQEEKGRERKRKGGKEDEEGKRNGEKGENGREIEGERERTSLG